MAHSQVGLPQSLELSSLPGPRGQGCRAALLPAKVTLPAAPCSDSYNTPTSCVFSHGVQQESLSFP